MSELKFVEAGDEGLLFTDGTKLYLVWQSSS